MQAGADGRQRIAQFVCQRGQKFILALIPFAKACHQSFTFLLALFACGDVGPRAVETAHLPGLVSVVDRQPPVGLYPVPGAVRLHHPVLDGIRHRRLEPGRGVHRSLHGRPVIGVDVGEVLAIARVLLARTPDGAESGVALHRAGLHVQVPGAELGSVQRQAPPFFAGMQLRFDALL